MQKHSLMAKVEISANSKLLIDEKVWKKNNKKMKEKMFGS